jgi:flagellar basal body-associated protein FliL
MYEHYETGTTRKLRRKLGNLYKWPYSIIIIIIVIIIILLIIIIIIGVLGYRSGGPGSIPGTTRKSKVVGLERGPLSLVSTTEELLDRKVAAPV